MMRPDSRTTIRSARRTEATLCETITQVRPGRSAVEGLLDPGLGLGVQGAGAVVQEQHGRLGHDRAGQGQPLALSAGERIAAFADRRIEAGGQRGDRVGEVGDPEGFPHLVPRSPPGWHRAGWCESSPRTAGPAAGTSATALRRSASLRSRTSRPSKQTAPQDSPVGVDSLGDVVEPGGQGQQGRLARTAGAQDAEAHPRLDPQVDAVEDLGALRRIRERDAAILDRPARADDGRGTGTVADRLGLVEDLEEPLDRDLGRQGGCLELRQPHDRLIELAHQGIDRQQLADGQQAAADQNDAVSDDEDRAQAADQGRQRPQGRRGAGVVPGQGAVAVDPLVQLDRARRPPWRSSAPPARPRPVRSEGHRARRPARGSRRRGDATCRRRPPG